MRILFYCHNVYGLGHIVRTLRLAQAAADLGAECHVVTGCRRLDALKPDPRVRIERLPVVEITPEMRMCEAGVPDGFDVLDRRTKRIAELGEALAPDVFVVDYSATGLGGELVPVLSSGADWLRGCRIVWGVPYAKRISATSRPPRNPRVRAAMERYDAVLAYTDAAWENPLPVLEPAGLPLTRFFSGYITGHPSGPREHRIVVLAGGGRGVRVMAEVVAAALRPLLQAGKIEARFVAGPLGDTSELGALAAVPGLRVEAEATVEAAAGADLVISRCGYNSAYTLMCTEAPVIFLPQITACREQLDRAGRLAALEGVRELREDAEGAAATLRDLVRRALDAGRGKRQLPFRVNGQRTAAEFLLREADESPPHSP